MSTLKRCYRCKNLKDISLFHRDKNCKDGHSYECKECRHISSSLRNRTIEGKEKDRNRKIKHKEKRLWYGAKTRAKEFHLDFDITPNDIVIPDICPVLGIPIIRDARGRSDGSPTIDRIDSTRGYTKDNICVISNKANTIKNNGTIEDHLKIIEYMRNHGQ